MKILLISDTHLGITTDGQIKVMLKKAQLDGPYDLIIHAGDYSGGLMGHKKVEQTLQLIRHYFPVNKIVSTIGNHDYWCDDNQRKRHQNLYGDVTYVKARPSLNTFNENLEKISASFKKHQVHYLDEDGIYLDENFPRFIFIGLSGWYMETEPETNDAKFMPFIEGGMHKFLLEKNEIKMISLIEKTKKLYDESKELIFISHFPIVKGEDYKNLSPTKEEANYDWNPKWQKILQQQFNCKYFLNGHSHVRDEGPDRYQAGSDYGRPRHLVIKL